MAMRRSTARLFSTASRCLQHSKPEGQPGKKSSRLKPSQESLDYVRGILAEPTWSITSLLPPSNPKSTSTTPPMDPKDQMNPEKLRHLLRLSALPMPKDKAHEDSMIQDLNDHLYFMSKIREVDTTGVEPLVAIRDETKEKAITLEDILEEEKKLEAMGPMGAEDWDPFANAKERVGNYFVVEGEMGDGSAEDVVISAEEVKKVDSLETVEARKEG
ncbi:hypothetical protein H072_1127 [Dactylellina haptotyla CBS 200.50]|uniref:Glutamyl-tRNA amidotransferase complex subunit Gta3 domain-containing protein n=1 Tax=Dactylellina haptotyla (strain CBS 200.50) TaxID=1284197 RepID=S8CB26_DACHA|nr:hypothetical protein H072_1127 [Dactylellina haptotyla CBS 200.50]